MEEVAPAGAPDVLDDQLISQLVDRAKADGIQLTGEGGLLQQLTKRILESALEGEITDHLGHEKHERAESGNVRNGTRAKTVITDVGPVEIEVPRDRAGSFEPQIVKKRQRRLNGVDEMVLSLSACGLTHGEISAHLKEVYGAEVSKTTISTITDRVKLKGSARSVRCSRLSSWCCLPARQQGREHRITLDLLLSEPHVFIDDRISTLRGDGHPCLAA